MNLSLFIYIYIANLYTDGMMPRHALSICAFFPFQEIHESSGSIDQLRRALREVPYLPCDGGAIRVARDDVISYMRS